MSALDWPAVDDIIAERNRQVSAEGWSAEHDDIGHDDGELAAAAATYAIAATGQWVDGEGPYNPGLKDPPSCWPWSPRWWKPGVPRRMLVKAGALIVAEIDRLDRKAARNG